MYLRHVYEKGVCFFKRIHPKRTKGQIYKYWFSFYVIVEGTKFTSHISFESDTPIMAYQKHNQNSYCFGSLDSALKGSNQLSIENAISTRISSSITGEILDRLMLANSIMTDKVRKKGDRHLRYKP